MVVICNVNCGDRAFNVDIKCPLRIFLSKSWQNSSQVNHSVWFAFLHILAKFFAVRNVKFFIATREIKVVFTDVSREYSISAYLIAKLLYEQATDLPVSPCDEESSLLPRGLVFMLLVCCVTLRLDLVYKFWRVAFKLKSVDHEFIIK